MQLSVRHGKRECVAHTLSILLSSRAVSEGGSTAQAIGELQVSFRPGTFHGRSLADFITSVVTQDRVLRVRQKFVILYKAKSMRYKQPRSGPAFHQVQIMYLVEQKEPP